MQTCRIGETDIKVSRLGLGTVKFGRTEGVKYPTTFSLPTDTDITHLLQSAKECGINLLDTAPAYGSSEERLGKLLQDERHDWIISTKVGETFSDGTSTFDFSPQAILTSVERSLKRLQTDYVDIVLVHSNGDDERIIKEEGVFEALSRLKQAGKIRAFGMSTKTISGGILTLDQADIAMVTYNPSYTNEHTVIQHAHTHSKAIFIKKALGSGHLTATHSLPFVLAEPGVTSVIIGTINAKHLRENVLTAKCV